MWMNLSLKLITFSSKVTFFLIVNEKIFHWFVSESDNEINGGERRKRQANSKIGGGGSHVEAECKVSTYL